jgi:hypothetical protein
MTPLESGCRRGEVERLVTSEMNGAIDPGKVFTLTLLSRQL